MEIETIRKFFDDLADTWDRDLIIDPGIVNSILDNAAVSKGKTILDVACGTGVLMPFYLEREVKSVTAVDLSPKMIAVALEKYDDQRISFICGDILDVSLPQKYDCIVVYNAFPHFPDQRGLIKRLSSLLKDGGTLTIAHGMSRERINAHHDAAASGVSLGLMEANELEKLFLEHLSVKTVISDEKMYEVVGLKE
ncbi:MAG: class I SAM-dependent methyltransferase [Lachnospiraceae bacterium]|nr:class I SAM-dependent methyltransferase [Lachnospiraceae bacterium]